MSDGTIYNAQGRINRLSVLCIDAYGVAVKNGFKGTVDEWLVSLKGDKGEPGAVDFEALTPDQIEQLRGEPFTYEDFTPEQLEALKGEDGYTPQKGVDYFDGEDGKDGKSAYQYAKESGYNGTEQAFSQKLAQDIPTKLPNPYGLTINGTSYDGSKAVNVQLEVPDIDSEEVNALIDTKMHSVKTYGAKGDGSTNDTAAFQEALAANRKVFVPGGTYKLNGTLVIRENCCLELSQDTFIQFGQTAGNCIEMRGSAVLRGNHAMISVPYAFTGNVICMDTTQDGTNHNNIPPYLHSGSTMFKRQRFVYDVNIVKPMSNGLCWSADGACSGKAIYLSCTNVSNTSTDIPWMWAITMSGIRIAGAFTHGIHAINYDSAVGSTNHYTDDAWNHDMRIEATIEACEIGVALENCNCAYLDVTVQPCKGHNNGAKYAKWGIYLNDSKNVDCSRSRVWDWIDNTLWEQGGMYQHIGLVGNCRGLILSDFLYYEESRYDIRELIYTDTPANLEKMTILQEPITRWFKTVDNVPYYFNGDRYEQLTTKKEFQACFNTDMAPTFTDVLATAEDRNGEIYNGTGYWKNHGFDTSGNEYDGSAYAYNVSTGFIAAKVGDVIRAQNILFDRAIVSDGKGGYLGGNCGIQYYDANHNFLIGQTCVAMIVNGSSYYQKCEQTDDGFKITLNPGLADKGTVAYVRFLFYIHDFGENPFMSINEEIGFEQHGFLADGIKVKAKNVVGGTGGGGSSAPSDWNAAEGEPGHVLNRPFYPYNGKIVTEVIINASSQDTVVQQANPIIIGNTYTIHWGDATYTCEALDGSVMSPESAGFPVMGNIGFFDESLGYTDEPFIMASSGGYLQVVGLGEDQEIPFSIDGEIYVKIPEKYIPDSVKGYVIEVTPEEWATLDAENTITMSQSYDPFIDYLYTGGKVSLALNDNDLYYMVSIENAVFGINQETKEFGLMLICNLYVGAIKKQIAFRFNGTKFPPVPLM